MEPAERLVTRVEAFSLVQWRTRPEIALASTRCVGAIAASAGLTWDGLKNSASSVLLQPEFSSHAISSCKG
jgi:hypothetical protein